MNPAQSFATALNYQLDIEPYCKLGFSINNRIINPFKKLDAKIIAKIFSFLNHTNYENCLFVSKNFNQWASARIITPKLNYDPQDRLFWFNYNLSNKRNYEPNNSITLNLNLRHYF